MNINSSSIPNGYEGVALNLDFPVFDDHAFSPVRRPRDTALLVVFSSGAGARHSL